MASIFRTTRGNEYSSPKTVLGFYAGLLVILELGVAAVLAFVVSQDDLHYLVPWVLGFGAFLFVAVVAVVVIVNIADPTKLQLGQMTGREFLDYQRVTRGDSIGGEYLEPPPGKAGEVSEIRVLPALDEDAKGAEGVSRAIDPPEEGEDDND